MENKQRTFFSNITTRVKGKLALKQELESKNRKHYTSVELESNTLKDLVEEGRLRIKDKKNRFKAPVVEIMEENAEKSTQNQLNLDIDDNDIQKLREKYERRSPNRSYTSENIESDAEGNPHNTMENSINENEANKNDTNIQHISEQLHSTHIGGNDWGTGESNEQTRDQVNSTGHLQEGLNGNQNEEHIITEKINQEAHKLPQMGKITTDTIGGNDNIMEKNYLLRSRIAEQEDEIKNFYSKNQQLAEQYQKNKEELQSIIQETRYYQQENKKMENKMIKGDLVKSQKECQQLQTKNIKNAHIKSQMLTLEEEVENLNNENERKNEQLIKLKKENKQMIDEVIESQKQVSVAEKLIERLLEEITNLKEENKRWKKQASNGEISSLCVLK
jgi:hypothetical protein